MSIIAVFNHDPGGDRTTLSRQLLAAIGRVGQRPWGIDLDPRAELSRAFATAPDDVEETMVAFFRDGVPLTHVAHITRSGVVLCPAHPALADIDRSLGKSFPAITRLRRAVREPGTATGPVVIDCPGALGSLALNAVCAATVVLVPVARNQAAVAGAAAVQRSLDALQKAVREPLARKYVPTRTPDEDPADGQWRAALGEAVPVHEIVEPELVIGAVDAPRSAPDSEGAAYDQLLAALAPASEAPG